MIGRYRSMTLTAQHLTMSYLIDAHCDALALTHSPSTITDRRRCLRRLHHDLPFGVAYAATEQIRAWLANPAWSDATRYTYTGHVLEAYRWWTAHGWLDGDPTADIHRPRQPRGRPRPAREEHIAALLSLAEPIPTITLLGAYEGMRRAEIAAAMREHFSAELVLIPRAKGGQAQSVPTHPLVWQHIFARAPGPLVVDQHGHQASPQQVSRMWRRGRAQVGLPDIVPHQLRHRFGTQVRRQHDVLVAKQALRHSSLTSTEVYTEIGSEEVADAIRSLPPVEPRPAGIRPGPPAQAA